MRYLSKHTLWKLAGYDPVFLESCPIVEKDAATSTGNTLVFFCFISVLSFYYALALTFDNYFTPIPIAFFCSFFFINIYRFILVTICNKMLPHTKGNEEPLFMTRTVRYSFVFFFALMVAKPIELFVFAIPIEQHLQNDKVFMFRSYLHDIRGYLGEEEHIAIHNAIDRIEEIEQKKKEIQYQHIRDSSTVQRLDSLETQSSIFQNQIHNIINAKHLIGINAKERIKKSHYFMKRLRILCGDFPFVWLITICFCYFFSRPLRYKLKHATTQQYEQHKADFEKELIESSYTEFKKDYSKTIRKQLINPTLNEGYFYEVYADAPFNTIRKKDNRVFKSVAELNTSIEKKLGNTLIHYVHPEAKHGARIDPDDRVYWLHQPPELIIREET